MLKFLKNILITLIILTPLATIVIKSESISVKNLNKEDKDNGRNVTFSGHWYGWATWDTQGPISPLASIDNIGSGAVGRGIEDITFIIQKGSADKIIIDESNKSNIVYTSDKSNVFYTIKSNLAPLAEKPGEKHWYGSQLDASIHDFSNLIIIVK